MWFLAIGLVVLVMKLAEVGPGADWPWWGVAIPFGLAAAWWGWADATGYTKRREMAKMEEKKAERRRKNLDNLGMDERGRRHSRDKK